MAQLFDLTTKATPSWEVRGDRVACWTGYKMENKLLFWFVHKEVFWFMDINPF
jgi:hypothetical protein